MKCPHCGEEIEEVEFEREVREWGTYDGEDFIVDESEVVDEVLTCPKCGKELSWDEVEEGLRR